MSFKCCGWQTGALTANYYLKSFRIRRGSRGTAGRQPPPPPPNLNTPQSQPLSPHTAQSSRILRLFILRGGCQGCLITRCALFLPCEHGNMYPSTSFPCAVLIFLFSKRQLWHILRVHSGGWVDAGAGKKGSAVPAPKQKSKAQRTQGAWRARSSNCNKSPVPGGWWLQPQETWPLRCILSASARHTPLLFFADAQSSGFVIRQLILNIAHPTPGEKAARAKPFLSLSVVLQALGVFTLNSRPWKRIYSLITGIKGNVSQGDVRLLCAFSKRARVGFG